MLQSLNTTINELEKYTGTEKLDITRYAERLNSVLKFYASEILRDLNTAEGHTAAVTGNIFMFSKSDDTAKVEAGFYAGHLFALLGKTKEALQLFDRVLAIREAKRDRYHKFSSNLEFVVEALEEAEVQEKFLRHYKEKLEKQRKREKQTPRKIKQKIAYSEADLECETGELDDVCTYKRAEQAELFVKLGDYRKAIAFYNKSNKFSRGRNFQDYYVPNTLRIVDCHLELREQAKADERFLKLLKTLFPTSIKAGEELPSEFLDNFNRLLPYFYKLNMHNNLEKAVNYATVRLNSIESDLKPKIKQGQNKVEDDKGEIRGLAQLMVDYHVNKEEYAKASDVIDRVYEMTRSFKYPPRFSLRGQAEYLIRAGNKERARVLIKKDENDRDRFRPPEDKEKELANLYLQLGDIDSALNVLDNFCEHYKGSLAHGDYGEILDTRVIQINISRKILGPDFTKKIREDIVDKRLLAIP